MNRRGIALVAAALAGCSGGNGGLKATPDGGEADGAGMAGAGGSPGTAGADGSADARGADAYDPLARCTWQAPAGMVTSTLTSNNAVELTGAPLGTGAAPAPELRRRVPVEVTASRPGLQLGEAWLTRSAGNDTAFLIIPVRNTGAAYDCFIRFEKVHWRSATGAEVESQGVPARDTGFVTGSVGGNGTTYTDTCLAAGELGYFPEIRLARGDGRVFSDVVRIELAFSAPTTFAVSPTADKLVAASYEAGACVASPGLRFRLENRGARAVWLDQYATSWGVLLDGDGAPLGWHYFDSGKTEMVAPGAAAVVGDDLVGNLPPWRVHLYTNFLAQMPRTLADRRMARLLDEAAASRRRLRELWQSANLPAAAR
jgi:hypothetical protein